MRDQQHLNRRRFPTSLLFVLLLVISLIVLFSVLYNASDPVARAARESAVYRQRQLDSELSGLDLIVSAGWRLTPLALILGSSFVALALVWRRFAAHEYIKAYHVTQYTRAASQRFPAALQNLTLHESNRSQIPAPSDMPVPALAPAGATTPAFSDLLNQNRVGRGNPLILGYTEGKELSGSWLDLYSTAIAGLTGTGKTTTQRFFACQTAMHRARFAIVDPHAGAADDSLAATLAPLESAFLSEPASEDRDILQAVRMVAEIGHARVSGKTSGPQTPVILWVDELTTLLGRSRIAAPLAELLERIAQEYRKCGVYLCASGQIWLAARTGETSALRDSFASTICHRMRRTQARLLLPADQALRCEALDKPGQAILWRASGESNILTIPNTTAADVRRVAGLLSANQPTMPRVASGALGSRGSQMEARVDHEARIDQASSALGSRGSHKTAYTVESDDREARWKPDGSQMEAKTDQASTASGSNGSLSPEAARVLALFCAGADVAQIVAEVYQTPSGGRAYQERSREVQAVIRSLLR